MITFEEYKNNPTIASRNKLAQQNMGLVRKCANDVCKSTPNNVEFEDLVQEGAIALISVIDTFDPSKRCAFSSYAVPHIKGRMYHYIRDKSHLIRPPRKYHNLISKSRKLWHTNYADMAKALDVSTEEWQAAKLAHRQLINLDAPVSNESDMSIGETIAEEKDVYLSVTVNELLDTLPINQRIAIELTYFEELTQREISRIMNCAHVTVKRYQRKGLERLSEMVA